MISECLTQPKYQSHSDLFIGLNICQLIKYRLCSPIKITLFLQFCHLPPLGLENSIHRSTVCPLVLE